MIRRIAFAVAAAAALVLVPSAAMAYAPAGFTFTVTDSTPAAGSPFTVLSGGADANTDVTLAVNCENAPDQTLTETADGNGDASFSVTISDVGTCSLVARDVLGIVIGTQTVEVLGANSGAGAPLPGLAKTGFEGAPLLVGGGVLVLAGAGAVLVTRRRKSAKVAA